MNAYIAADLTPARRTREGGISLAHIERPSSPLFPPALSLPPFLSISLPYLPLDPIQQPVSQHQRQVLLFILETESNVLPAGLQLMDLEREKG